MADRTNVQQSGLGCWVNQQIQITPFGVPTGRSRTEYTRVARAVRRHNCAYFGPVVLACVRWLHLETVNQGFPVNLSEVLDSVNHKLPNNRHCRASLESPLQLRITGIVYMTAHYLR